LKARKQHVGATQTLKESTVQTYLVRRNGRYSYRRRIPNDLIELYGKEFITKALGTADRREAERLARAMSVEHDNEFTARRTDLSSPSPNQPADQSNEYEEFLADAPDETRLFPQKQRRQIQLHYDHNSEVGDVHALAARILHRLRGKREEAVASDTLDDFLRELRIDLSWDKAALKGEADLLYPTWQHEAYQIARQQLLEPGRYAPLPTPSQMQQRPATQAVGLSGNTGEATSLDKLVEYWKQDGSHTNIRTIEKTELVVRRFKKIVGDLPIQIITKKQCVAFRDAIRASGKTISTTIDHTDRLRALFAVAKSRDLIQQNPAEGLTLKDPIPAKEKRMPFDTPALVRIFSSPIYTAGERPDAGAGEAAYWLPLLALFTGARLEELGQLHPDDVYQETYEDEGGMSREAWVLRIAEVAEGQELKNKGSTRRVPLHPELIRLGFIEFVEARRKRTRIFYELTPDTRGRETGNWSKWFGRWRRTRCGINGSLMTFHSFRHLFKDLCRAAGMDEPVHDAMTGHVGEGNRVARAYGAGAYPLKPLVEGMRKYKVPADLQAVLDGLSPYRA
jgi:integrase